MNVGRGEMISRQSFLSQTAVSLIVAVFLVAAGGLAFSQNPHSDSFVYVGTYTNTPAKSQGIYSYHYDARTGHLTSQGVAAELASPSFLATDSGHRVLYAVTEVGSYPNVKGAKADQTVSSYSINARTGALTFLNRVSSGGGAPCI
jgi:6-phosphogluconolactonase